ncbi:MAG TPA: MerR family transcriptional regulator [Streptosporangiaceae bacterium]|jgi:DNA-binding transcriptional MerR regulator
MRIGELSRVTGASTRSLRHYEEQGLLSPARGGNGYRDYSEADAVRVRNIRFLLDSGLTLDDARALGPCLDGDIPRAAPSPAMLSRARDRLERLRARIEDLTEAHTRLTARLHAAESSRTPH